MIKTSIKLQDLRRKIYLKAKAERTWRFWGLYVHVCKTETLMEAYRLVKRNGGAPGIDGITFDMIEEYGVDMYVATIQDELTTGTYRPQRNRKKAIPKGNGKERILGIPCIRDRIVQGALKLILEPVFDADFQDGSFGYRPKRTAHMAVNRVYRAAVRNKTRIIDVDLKAYFDNVRHHILLDQVSERINDEKVMRLLKLMLKAGGKRGVPQGGVISPLLANIYLNEVDKMLEKAKDVTRKGKYTYVEYARYADDLVILIDGFRKWEWLEKGIYKRLLEELAKLDVSINTDKTKCINLERGETFSFLGFDFRRVVTREGSKGVCIAPKMMARTKLLGNLKAVFRRFVSQPVDRVIDVINPVLRGWCNYFRIGHSSKCFGFVRDWVEKKVRRHLMKVRKRNGFGWNRWSRAWLYKSLGLYDNYKISYYYA